MLLNDYNLSIVKHAADKPIKGHAVNTLQFTKTGTLAINGHYSVAVSALSVSGDDVTGCIPTSHVKTLQERLDNGMLKVEVAKLPITNALVPIKLPDNPVQFEVFLNANLLLKIVQSARDFDEDAVVRIQFTGATDPVRMDARNTTTGQKWEALLMPRELGKDVERFAEPVPPPPSIPTIHLVPPPPPPSIDDQLAEALALANKLAGV